MFEPKEGRGVAHAQFIHFLVAYKHFTIYYLYYLLLGFRNNKLPYQM